MLPPQSYNFFLHFNIFVFSLSSDAVVSQMNQLDLAWINLIETTAIMMQKNAYPVNIIGLITWLWSEKEKRKKICNHIYLNLYQSKLHKSSKIMHFTNLL